MIEKMDFSFGICSSRETCGYLPKIVESIKNLNIPDYEIIIIGNVTTVKADEHVKIIEFDETEKPKWLNKKKNMITQNAQYENVVYIHDYNAFDSDWYKGFLKFGNDFKIASSVTLNLNGDRYRDWTLLWDAIEGVPKMQFILPYHETRLSKYMYLNGAYWVAKKHVMEEYPLDKDLVWGQGEDVVWSKRVTEKYNFSMNTFSTVRMLKNSGRAWDIMSDHIYNNVVIPFIEKNNL